MTNECMPIFNQSQMAHFRRYIALCLLTGRAERPCNEDTNVDTNNEIDNAATHDEELDLSSDDSKLVHALHVGDVIEYRTVQVGSIGNKLMREQVIEIKKETKRNNDDEEEDTFKVSTTAFWEIFDYDQNPGFRIIQSSHDDAPPIGKWTSLQRVNLIEGRDEATEEEKAERRRTWLTGTPRAVEMAGFAFAATDVRKMRIDNVVSKEQEKNNPTWMSRLKHLRKNVGEDKPKPKCVWESGGVKCKKRANAKCSLKMCKTHCQKTYTETQSMKHRCKQPSHRNTKL